MPSEIRADNFFDPTGIGGIKTSAVHGRLISAAGFDFIERAGCLYPVNKTRVAYSATGADQTFVVPSGITRIFAKVWGAGGGNGRAGGWSYGADGGGGGHARAIIPVTPGTSLTVKVGVGGRTATFGSSFGGGGGTLNTSDVTYGGQGGGGSYIFSGSTPLLIAGGGGGGGSSRAWTGNVGGAGGGITGQKGESPYDAKPTFGGGGGTQTAGGASVGTAGSLYQGGVPNTNSYGGGGGGGYYGGGGGGYSESNTMAGGGGGSGFTANTNIMGALFTGDFRMPAMSWDEDLDDVTTSGTTLTAHGAQNLQNNVGAGVQTGGNGLIVIYY